MESNRTLIEKADLSVQELLTNGGALLPEQASKFIEVMIEESRLLPEIDVIPMRSPIKQLDKIKFGTHILRNAKEYTALSVADRSKPDLSKTTLTAQLLKGEVRLSNEDLEDNIEGGNFRDVVMRAMTARCSADVEGLVLEGDTTRDHSLFSTFDGILKKATAHVYDHLDQGANNTLFREMLKILPKPYRRDKTKLRYFVSGNTEIDWRDALGARQTPGGDSWLAQAAANISYTGIPVIDVPLMPEDTGVGNNRAQALLLDPANIALGVHREILIETDKDIQAGAFIIVVSLRMDVTYKVDDAVVKAIKIKV